MNYRLLLLFFVFLVGLGTSAIFAQGILPDPDTKLGAKYKVYFLPEISLISFDTTGDFSSVAKKTDVLSGPLIFYEKMFTDSFGAGVYGGQMIRQTKIRIDSIESILKDNTLILGFYAKSYTVKTKTNGLKYHIGAHYELVRVDVSFQNTSRNVRESAKGAIVPVVGFSGGLDYKLKYAAFSFELGQSFGESRVNGEKHQYLFRFDTLFVSISIMSLF